MDCQKYLDSHNASLPFSYIQGGIYEGAFAIEAARRYEEVWLPILQKTPETVNLIPPVDIAFAALVHRVNPSAFQADMAKLGIKQLDSKGKPWPSPNPFDFTDGGANYAIIIIIKDRRVFDAYPYI